METLLQTEDGPDNFLDVLFLVVRRYNDDTIATVHVGAYGGFDFCAKVIVFFQLFHPIPFFFRLFFFLHTDSRFFIVSLQNIT